MDTTEFDRKIEHLEKTAKGIRDRLEKEWQDLASVLQIFAKNWCLSKVEKALVEEFPERAKDLGTGGVKKIKADLDIVLARLPEDMKRLLKEDSNWPHRFGADLGGYALDRDVESLIIRLFNKLVGPAGAILQEHRLSSSGEWRQEGGNTVRNYGINLPEDIKGRLSQYVRGCAEFKAAQKNVELAKEERSRAVAKDIWDKS